MASSVRLRVFLDSNVLFAGIYTPKGTTGAVLEQASSGSFTLVLSTAVIEELAHNVRRKAPAAIPRLELFFRQTFIEATLPPTAEEVEVWTRRGLTTDARIAAAATLAEVDYLCTGDSKFRATVLAHHDGPAVLTPRQLLDLLTL